MHQPMLRHGAFRPRHEVWGLLWIQFGQALMHRGAVAIDVFPPAVPRGAQEGRHHIRLRRRELGARVGDAVRVEAGVRKAQHRGVDALLPHIVRLAGHEALLDERGVREEPGEAEVHRHQLQPDAQGTLQEPHMGQPRIHHHGLAVQGFKRIDPGGLTRHDALRVVLEVRKDGHQGDATRRRDEQVVGGAQGEVDASGGHQLGNVRHVGARPDLHIQPGALVTTREQRMVVAAVFRLRIPIRLQHHPREAGAIRPFAVARGAGGEAHQRREGEGAANPRPHKRHATCAAPTTRRR